MVLRESIAANPHEGKLLFRLGQYTCTTCRPTAPSSTRSSRCSSRSSTTKSPSAAIPPSRTSGTRSSKAPAARLRNFARNVINNYARLLSNTQTRVSLPRGTMTLRNPHKGPRSAAAHGSGRDRRPCSRVRTQAILHPVGSAPPEGGRQVCRVQRLGQVVEAQCLRPPGGAGVEVDHLRPQPEVRPEVVGHVVDRQRPDAPHAADAAPNQFGQRGERLAPPEF